MGATEIGDHPVNGRPVTRLRQGWRSLDWRSETGLCSKPSAAKLSDGYSAPLFTAIETDPLPRPNTYRLHAAQQRV